MAGANYMGGARSAAKRRLRDTTTRAQKDFFSRQRLNASVLSKQLTSRSSTVFERNPLRPRSPEEGITLSHASYFNRTRKSSNGHDLDETQTSALAVSPKPHENREQRAVTSKTSAVTDKVETTYVQRNIDRLLKADDLLGLERLGLRMVPPIKRKNEEKSLYLKKQRTDLEGHVYRRVLNANAEPRPDNVFAYQPPPPAYPTSPSFDRNYSNDNDNNNIEPDFNQEMVWSSNTLEINTDEFLAVFNDNDSESSLFGPQPITALGEQRDDTIRPLHLRKSTFSRPAIKNTFLVTSGARLRADSAQSDSEVQDFSPPSAPSSPSMAFWKPGDSPSQEASPTTGITKNGSFYSERAQTLSSPLSGMNSGIAPLPVTPSRQTGSVAPHIDTPNGQTFSSNCGAAFRSRSQSPTHSPSWAMKMSPVTVDTWLRAGIILGFELEADDTAPKESSSHSGDTVAANSISTATLTGNCTPLSVKNSTFLSEFIQDPPPPLDITSPTLANPGPPRAVELAKTLSIDHDDEIMTISSIESSPLSSPIETPFCSPTSAINCPPTGCFSLYTHFKDQAGSQAAKTTGSSVANTGKLNLTALGARISFACRDLKAGVSYKKQLEIQRVGTISTESRQSSDLSEANSGADTRTPPTPTDHISANIRTRVKSLYQQDTKAPALPDINLAVSTGEDVSIRVGKPEVYAPECHVAIRSTLGQIDNPSWPVVAEITLLSDPTPSVPASTDNETGNMITGGSIDVGESEKAVIEQGLELVDAEKDSMPPRLDAVSSFSLFSAGDEAEEDGYDD